MTENAAGRDVVDMIIEDHREIDMLFTELESGQHSTERRRELADVMIAQLVRHEENDLLPRLRAASDADEMVALGRKFEQAKKLVPTRPHPAAPDHAPLNKILGPGAGLIDRVRDALSGRSTTVGDLTDRSH